MILRKENQAENILYLEHSGSPEQAVGREICLWYVIQNLMKLQDASGRSGQGEKDRGPSHTPLGVLRGLRDLRFECSSGQKRRAAVIMAVGTGAACVLELILSLHSQRCCWALKPAILFLYLFVKRRKTLQNESQLLIHLVMTHFIDI